MFKLQIRLFLHSLTDFENISLLTEKLIKGWNHEHVWPTVVPMVGGGSSPGLAFLVPVTVSGPFLVPGSLGNLWPVTWSPNWSVHLLWSRLPRLHFIITTNNNNMKFALFRNGSLPHWRMISCARVTLVSPLSHRLIWQSLCTALQIYNIFSWINKMFRNIPLWKMAEITFN